MEQQNAEQRLERMQRHLENIRHMILRSDYSRTADGLVSNLNWFLAASTAIFLFLSGWANNFIIDGKLPMKWIYIFALTLCGCSICLFASARMMVASRQLHFNYAYDKLDSLIAKLKDENPQPETFPEGLAETLFLYDQAISFGDRLLTYGTKVFLLGFMLSVIYLFIFIFKFL